MLSNFDWSISRYLENQVRRFQVFKNRSQETATLQMDGPTSIITQVSRDGEPANNGYVSSNKDNKSLRGSIKKKAKSEKQNPIFRSMLCCLGRPKRKPPTDEKPINNLEINNSPYTVEVTIDHTPPPTPTIANQTEDNDNNAVPNDVQDFKFLLPAKPQNLSHKKCAVIDLDETLVHSSFKPISNADFVIPVEIDGTVHQVYVLKRPHVDAYLQRMGELYECVLFTASLAKYADPVADLLDKQGVFTSRLFRESCVFHRGNYVKDLSLIGREMNKMIIIDNSPASYIFHPDNAVPVLSWFDDPSDTELLDLLPFLEAIAESDDVYPVLRSHGFTSHAKETTASIQQLQHQLQLQHATEEEEEER